MRISYAFLSCLSLGFGGLGLAAVMACAGCATVPPYQREILSTKHMNGESERDEDKFRQHWQESREGGAGGYAAAGGGCGCN